MIPERAKLRSLKNHLIGLEMTLDIIERDLLIAHQNLDYLTKVEQDLIINITFLKKEKIVSIASEYKKAKEELIIVRKNIQHYQNTRVKLERENEGRRRAYQKYYQEYKDLERFLENRKVILLFDPSRKKKKEDNDEG